MLSEKELVVLSELRKNSRISIAEISRRKNIPLSTVFDIIKKNEKKLGLKYTSLVDFKKLGFWIKSVFVVDVNNKAEFESFLDSNSCVNSTHLVSNNTSYFVECIFKNMLEHSNFVDRLDEFGEKKQEIHIIEDLKRESFMTSPLTQ